MKKTMPDFFRICFITQKLPRLGVAADYGYLFPLCRSLAARGHQITVITPDTPSSRRRPTGGLPIESEAGRFYHSTHHETLHGVEIHYVETPMTGGGSDAFREAVLDRFDQLHHEKPFDLVHCVDNSGYLVAQSKKDLKVAVAADIKGIELDQIFGLLGLTEDTVSSYLKTSIAVAAKFLRSFFGNDHRYLKAADGIFVTSLQQRDLLELYYFIPSRRMHVIPYGIDASELVPTPPDQSPFEEIGIELGAQVILTISPLAHIEETKNLLTAFEKVVIKKPRTALVIVGEGPRRRELEEHMLNLALASKVWFTGEVSPETEDAMISTCDIYVNLLSISSGFEPSVLDAMACAKPVIASEVGTSSNLIRNGFDGYLMRPTDIVTLGRLLLEMAAGQVDSKSIGEHAREKILKMFDTKRMVDETIQAYQEILKGTGRYKSND